MTPRRISASRMPLLRFVRYAARRSELEVKGKARKKPSAVPTAMRPELY